METVKPELNKTMESWNGGMMGLKNREASFFF
jgi:hypothetical protein